MLSHPVKCEVLYDTITHENNRVRVVQKTLKNFEFWKRIVNIESKELRALSKEILIILHL